MSTAIERITGFACEVDEEQWRELVKVADEVGVKVWDESRQIGIESGVYAQLDGSTKEKDLCLFHFKDQGALIPYPDFLAKLKGDENWEPKNGERVEVSGNNQNWHERIFIVTHANMYYCVDANDQTSLFPWKHIRPLRPAITRKEAEQKLKELGVIARIVD